MYISKKDKKYIFNFKYEKICIYQKKIKNILSVDMFKMLKSKNKKFFSLTLNINYF